MSMLCSSTRPKPLRRFLGCDQSVLPQTRQAYCRLSYPAYRPKTSRATSTITVSLSAPATTARCLRSAISASKALSVRPSHSIIPTRRWTRLSESCMDYRDPEKSKINVKTTTPTELQNLLNTKPDLSLLDVRTPVEYAEVHVPHACNEPLNGLQPTVLFHSGRLRQGQPIYLMGLLLAKLPWNTRKPA